MNDKIDLLSRRFNKYMNLQYQQEKDKRNRLNRVVGAALKQFTGRSREEFDTALGEIISGNKTLECAYILDHTGVQVSGTICDTGGCMSSENLIFYSAKKGTDHSMEKYYYPLTSGKLKKYTTEPYISLATGNLCITVSAVFVNLEGGSYILCADFRTAEESYNIELRVPSVGMNMDRQPEVASILDKMSEEIVRDGLTGAFNRRYLEERLIVDIFNAETYNQPLSVILADIDRFKEVNDRYGHLAGDQVLKKFVSVAKQVIRKDTDWVARYGGDEFVIVLPGADDAVAGRVAEKIRLMCEQTIIRYGPSYISFTVSFGTHTVTHRKATVDDLIGMADRNLYAAKKAGRNQISAVPEAPDFVMPMTAANR